MLDCHVQPRASRTEIAGVHGERLKLRIAAPPVDDAANKALIAFLAKAFKVPKGHIALLSGASGRDKRVAIAAPRRIPEWLDAP